MEVDFNLSDHITKNFIWEEFVCKDGTLRFNEWTFELFNRLQILRNIIGSISINSGYRSPEHNYAVGGAPNSKHMEAKAVDIRWVDKEWELTIVANIARGLGFYVIEYSWGLHLDTRLMEEEQK